MKPTSYLSALFRPSALPAGERPPCDFDLISRYFYNCPAEDASHTIDAETTADLDLNAVFERIDRTTSKVGQQCLYARIRTLRGQEDAEAFGRSTDCFSRNGELAASCTESLSRLTDEDAYGLQNLIFDTPAKVRYFAWVYPLTLLAVATLLAAPFYPLSLLLFMAVFAVNLYIHYSNKLNVSLYGSAVKQLSLALRTARELAVEEVPGTEEATGQIRQVAEVERRSHVVGTQGDSANELAAIAWLFIELAKVAFNIEVILFQRFIGSITARRDAIHGMFRFIGETDAAISVARLRSETQTCRPQFVDGKYLKAEQVVHPLIDGCVPNTLILDGTGLLLNPVFLLLIPGAFVAPEIMLENYLTARCPYDKTISFVSERRKITLDPAEILYVESNDSEVWLHTASGEAYRTKTRISQWESQLDRRFLRIHRSYIVNTAHVGEYHPSRVNVGGQEIEISRKYKDTARLRFESPAGE